MNRRTLAAAAFVIVLIAGAAWYFSADSARPVAGAGGAPRTVAVVTAQPVRKEFAHEVEALGTIRANESLDITVKIADRVAAIGFTEGQQVRKGAVLVQLDSDEVRADLAAAKAAESDSRSQFKRSQELFATRALSEAQLEQLEATMLANEARVAAAESRLKDRTITAPFAGRVGLRNVSIGSLVSPGAVITTLDDLSVVKLDFSVPEVFLSTLRPGLTVQASSSAYPNEAFVGRVASIDTRVDPATRSVAIRALIDNRDARLRPGMFMTLRLVRSAGQALMLPEQAIVPEGDRHYVYVVSDARARKQEVQTGRRRPGEVEILSGLSGDEQVVIDGTLNLRDGAAVRVVSAPAQNAESTETT